jgi:TP901 family phage tail tape measure protein
MADGKIVIETGLDTTGIENGLGKISSLAQKGLATATKTITATSAALSGMGGYAVKVGSSFEAAMSQVAATMGMSTEEIHNGSAEFTKLQEAAKNAGATTMFSATQAADALNYMALAGYDTNKAVNTLPTILNLAAAGNMDLATSSDMVTDSMSALGDKAGTVESFVDKMAKTSQKSNTSVQQLGEALLTVGGTAKSLAGGVTEANTVLGIFADNGVKGAEGGTALRNVILSLSAPTDTARKKMEELGLNVFDAEGKMRPLNGTFNDLNKILGSMNESERTQVLNTIFNKVDLKSVNALLANSGERFDQLKGYIENADGAAGQMADTMQDNLKGKLTALNSALEGLGIGIYENIEESLKEAAEEGINAVGRVSNALQNSGLDAAVEEAGAVLADLSVKVAQSAPKMVNASVSLLKAFVKGIANNKNQLKKSATDIVNTLCSGLIKLLPKKMQEPAKKGMDALKRTFDAGLKSVVKIAEPIVSGLGKVFIKLADNMDTVAPIAVSLVAAFKTFKTVEGPVVTVTSVVIKLSRASSEAGGVMAALNAVMSANPAAMIAIGIAALAGGIAYLALKSNEASKEQVAFQKEIDNLSASIEKNRNELDNLSSSIESTNKSAESSAAPLERLKNKMSEAFDETGKVKQGCEQLAGSILNQLNEAMGTEYSITADGFIQNNEGVKQSLGDVTQSIDEYVRSLKKKAVQEAVTNQYADNLQKQSEIQADLTKAQKQYNKALDEYAKAWNGNDAKAFEQANENLESTRKNLSEATKEAKKAEVQTSSLDKVMDLLGEGTPESIQKALDAYAKIPTESDKAAKSVKYSQETIEKALESTDYAKMSQGFRMAAEEIKASGGEIPRTLQDAILNAINNIEKLGPEGKEELASSMSEMMQGMKDKVPEFQHISSMTSDEIIKTFATYLKDSGALGDVGTEAIEQLIQGIDEVDTQTTPAQKASDAVDSTINQLETGEDFIRTAAGNSASAITRGFTETDYSGAVFAAAKACGMTVEEVLAHQEELYMAALTVAQSGATGFTAADMPAVFGSNASAAASAANTYLLSSAESMQLSASALGNAANTGIVAGNMPGTFSSQSQSAVSGLVNSLNSGAGSASSAASALGNAAKSGLGNMSVAGNYQTAATSATQSFARTLSAGQGNTKSSASALGNSAKTSLKGTNIPSNFTQQAKTATNQFAAGIRNGTNSASSAARGLGTAATKGLSGVNVASSAKSQGNKLGSSFVDGINEKKGSASLAAASLGSGAREALANNSGGSYSIGVNFSNGFANGIRAGGYGVASVAASVASAAANAAKANLQIHSPSRVGGWIGKMFDYGISGGMEDNTSVVTQAAEMVTDAMQVDVKSLLGMMRGAVSETVSRITTNKMLERAPQAYGYTASQNTEVKQEINFYQPVQSPIEVSRALRKEARRLALT